MTVVSNSHVTLSKKANKLIYHIALKSQIVRYKALLTRHCGSMCSHEKKARATFQLEWSWYGTGALSHWNGFLREGMCVMYSVRAHFSWQSLCLPQTSRQSRAARLCWRGSDALLQIITPPPDTQRHFKSTLPPPPRLSSPFISLVQEEITVSFLTSSFFLTHTKTLHCSPSSPYTVRWQGTGLSRVSTSLKTGLIIPASLFLLPHHLFTEAAPTASPISIYVASLLGPMSAAQ